MQDFGIDKSWIDAGLDIDLIRNIMSVIAEKRKDRTRSWVGIFEFV